MNFWLIFYLFFFLILCMLIFSKYICKNLFLFKKYWVNCIPSHKIWMKINPISLKWFKDSFEYFAPLTLTFKPKQMADPITDEWYITCCASSLVTMYIFCLENSSINATAIGEDSFCNTNQITLRGEPMYWFE